MDSESFRALYESDFPLLNDSEDVLILRLAREYLDETEAYDRMVCTGPIREDCILPATSRETSLISMNARKVLQAKTQIAESEGFSAIALKRAIQRMER